MSFFGTLQKISCTLSEVSVKTRDDLDTTSLGLTVIDMDTATKHKIMDEMLEYRNSDGIIQVYFDHSRPRIGEYLFF